MRSCFAQTDLVQSFDFQPEGDKTVVTWSMTGHNNFLGKAICMFMDMDEMIGADFEQGLASMKKIVEAEPQAEAESRPSAEPMSEQDIAPDPPSN